MATQTSFIGFRASPEIREKIDAAVAAYNATKPVKDIKNSDLLRIALEEYFSRQESTTLQEVPAAAQQKPLHNVTLKPNAPTAVKKRARAN